MKEQPKAAFKFENYKFVRFEFNERIHDEHDGIAVNIEPSGVFNKKDRRYTLKLDFKATLDNPKDTESTEKNIIVRLLFTAQFSLSEGVEDVPEYFYPNSIGIAFPYIRAFLSTLTLQANARLLLLPLLNLTHLAEPLRENTVIED